jgi:LacI family transcriptional regulator
MDNIRDKGAGVQVATTDAPSRRRGQPRLTIRDVARLSNVSVGTVSKALNNSGSLRQETRERVIAVAKEIGFRPNDLAQSLLRGKTFTVGLISNDSFGRFTMPIMEGLEECLADSRIAVFMANATDDQARSPACRAAGRQRSTGIVVTARRADQRQPRSATRPAGDLRLLADRRPRRLYLLPTTKAARRSRPSTSSVSRRRIAH